MMSWIEGFEKLITWLINKITAKLFFKLPPSQTLPLTGKSTSKGVRDICNY